MLILQLRNERHGFIQMSFQKRQGRGRNNWKSHRQTRKLIFNYHQIFFKRTTI